MDPKEVTDRMAAFLQEQNQAVLSDAWAEVLLHGGVTIEFGDDCRMKIVKHNRAPEPTPTPNADGEK